MRKYTPFKNKDYVEFLRGWDCVNTLATIPLGSMQKAENLEYRSKKLFRRKPFIEKSSVDFTTPGVFQGRHEYIDSAGTSRILHAHNDGTIKEFVSSSSSVDRVTGLTSALKVRFETMYNSVFACNGTDQLRRGDDTTWRLGGAPIPPTSLVLASGTGSNMAAATYLFMAVAVIESGGIAILKSDWLGASSITLASAGAVKVDWTASSDARVTHVYIYRTLGDVGAPFYYDGKVAIGTETYNANTVDASLSETIADNQFRNGQAPTGNIITKAGKRLAIISGKTVNLSTIATNAYEMEYFPNDGIHSFDAPGQGNITAATGVGVKDEDSNRSDLFIAQKNNCYILRSTDPQNILEDISGNAGVLNADAITQWGEYLFFVSLRGLEFYGPLGKPILISQKVQALFEGGGPLDLNGISGEQYIYLEVWQNKLLCSLRDSSSKTWGNKTLVLDLEFFDSYAEMPGETARYTYWTGPGMAFYLALENRELVLFDNENLKILKRSETARQDNIGDTLTNITAYLWTGVLMGETMNARKTIAHANVFQVCDSATKFEIEGNYETVTDSQDVSQVTNYVAWDKVWDKDWAAGTSWMANVPISRGMSANIFQVKLTIASNDKDYTFIGITLFYRAVAQTILGSR